MSFERFFSSDVYIFEHAAGYIQCCGCNLVKPDEDEIFGFAELPTPRDALAHLDLHELAGDDIGGARRRIEKEYEDLDATIEPYERPLELRERIREMLRLAQENNEQVD